MRTLPTYSSRYLHGEQTYMQPCDTTGGTQYIFAVATDRNKMTASAQSFMGAPTNGAVSFEGLGNVGLVHFIRAPKLTSIGQSVGYVDDRETAVSMPLAMREQGLLLPRYSVTTWMPYVLINSQGGCTAGREIFGFLKALGDITIPKLTDPLVEWSAKTQVFREMNPTCEAEWAPLWTVKSVGGAAKPMPLWNEAEELAGWLKGKLTGHSVGGGIFEDIELLASAIKWAIAMTFPTTNLKQFRDAADGTKATSQELVTAPMQVTKLRSGGLLEGNFELTLPTYASHDVAGDLGVVGGTNGTYPVLFGMYVDFDFIVPAGTVHWRYGD